MIHALRSWAQAAVRYRWFVGFGIAWMAIVMTITPVLAPIEDVLAEGQRAVTAVRGTLGAVSPQANSAADAIPIAQTFDATIEPAFDDLGPSFDEPPTFEGFEPSGEEPEAEPEPESDEPTGGEDPSGGCTTDTSLPAPVATTVVGAIAGAQQQVTDATGHTPPVDPAGTVGPAAGCGASSSGSHNGSTAPSLTNGVTAGGLTVSDLVRILFGW